MIARDALIQEARLLAKRLDLELDPSLTWQRVHFNDVAAAIRLLRDFLTLLDHEGVQEGNGTRVDRQSEGTAPIPQPTPESHQDQPPTPTHVSPLPWKQHTLLIRDATGGLVAHCTRWYGSRPEPEEAVRNAEYVVRACNSYPLLVSALRRLVESLNDDLEHPEQCDAWDAACEALKLAEQP